MRELFPLILLACVCGAAAWAGRAHDDALKARLAQAAGDPDAPVRVDEDADRARRFRRMESTRDAVAPGMRVIAEKESHGELVELLGDASRDTCVRVEYDSAEPVPARLFDKNGRIIARASTPNQHGVLPELGPICIRKGETIAAQTLSGAETLWVAWSTLPREQADL